MIWGDVILYQNMLFVDSESALRSDMMNIFNTMFGRDMPGHFLIDIILKLSVLKMDFLRHSDWLFLKGGPGKYKVG